MPQPLPAIKGATVAVSRASGNVLDVGITPVSSEDIANNPPQLTYNCPVATGTTGPKPAAAVYTSDIKQTYFNRVKSVDVPDGGVKFNKKATLTVNFQYPRRIAQGDIKTAFMLRDAESNTPGGTIEAVTVVGDLTQKRVSSVTVDIIATSSAVVSTFNGASNTVVFDQTVLNWPINLITGTIPKSFHIPVAQEIMISVQEVNSLLTPFDIVQAGLAVDNSITRRFVVGQMTTQIKLSNIVIADILDTESWSPSTTSFTGGVYNANVERYFYHFYAANFKTTAMKGVKFTLKTGTTSVRAEPLEDVKDLTYTPTAYLVFGKINDDGTKCTPTTAPVLTTETTACMFMSGYIGAAVQTNLPLSNVEVIGAAVNTGATPTVVTHSSTGERGLSFAIDKITLGKNDQDDAKRLYHLQGQIMMRLQANRTGITPGSPISSYNVPMHFNATTKVWSPTVWVTTEVRPKLVQTWTADESCSTTWDTAQAQEVTLPSGTKAFVWPASAPNVYLRSTRAISTVFKQLRRFRRTSSEAWFLGPRSAQSLHSEPRMGSA